MPQSRGLAPSGTIRYGVWLGTDGYSEEARINQDFYVQVRYSHGLRWVTVSMAENRGLASTGAAAAYKGLLDDRGDKPSQVRVVSAAQLIREGGQGAVAIADAQIDRRDGSPETP
jgi:hypothetical protein